MPEPQATQARLESEEHLTVIEGLIGASILSHIRREWKVPGVQPSPNLRHA
jgi:hypothetical protein